jgi:hypothetical protein
VREFRKSSRCDVNGSCVEISMPYPSEPRETAPVLVRDSKDDGPRSPVLELTPQEWDAFTAWIRSLPC